MSLKFVYLAGPIHKEPDPDTWREELSRMLPSPWSPVNPRRHEVNLDDPASIVRFDYRLIRSCDALIAQVGRPSWGTAMELSYALDRALPVIGIAPSWEDQSPWLLAHVDHKVTALGSAVAWLGEYAGGFHG